LAALFAVHLPPQRCVLMEGQDTPEGYSFTYADGLREGGFITEQLYIDKTSGRFSWSRSVDGKASTLAQGSTYLISQVSSVRFTTRLGDPSREFLNVADRQLLRKRGIQNYLNSTVPLVLSLAAMFCNVLTMALLFAIIMAYATWQMLPLDETKESFDMSRGPDSEGIGAVAVMSILTAMACLISGWWLGVFNCRKLNFDRDSLGLGSRLGDKVAARYSFQRNVNTSILGAGIAWCGLILILCPLTYVLSYKTDCEAGGCVSDPHSPFVPTCGVGNCSCGVIADLSCLTASSSADVSFCRNVKSPLCGAGSSDTVSGMHVPIIIMTFGTAAFTALIGLLWLLQIAAMLNAWVLKPDASNTVMVQEVQYHRFAVSLRAKKEAKMVFTMSAEDDPHAIAAALMPRGGVDAFAGRNMYQAPATLHGGFVAGGQDYPMHLLYTDPGTGGMQAVFESDGDNAELEPQWC